MTLARYLLEAGSSPRQPLTVARDVVRKRPTLVAPDGVTEPGSWASYGPTGERSSDR